MNNIKECFRNYKISIINDKTILKPSLDRFNILKNKYNSIDEEIEDYIITGSACLYIYGVIDRLPNDYDIIIKKSCSHKYKTSVLRDHYDNNIEINRLGYIEIPHRQKAVRGFISKLIGRIRDKEEILLIDIFTRDDKQIGCENGEICGYILDNPLNIINEKIRTGGLKNLQDLGHIFGVDYIHLFRDPPFEC